MRPIVLVTLVPKSRVGGDVRAVVQRAVRVAERIRYGWRAKTNKKVVFPSFTTERLESVMSAVIAAVVN